MTLAPVRTMRRMHPVAQVLVVTVIFGAVFALLGIVPGWEGMWKFGLAVGLAVAVVLQIVRSRQTR
jgi:hypothetical protein